MAGIIAKSVKIGRLVTSESLCVELPEQTYIGSADQYLSCVIFSVSHFFLFLRKGTILKNDAEFIQDYQGSKLMLATPQNGKASVERKRCSPHQRKCVSKENETRGIQILRPAVCLKITQKLTLK